jgi:hypothetical protein
VTSGAFSRATSAVALTICILKIEEIDEIGDEAIFGWRFGGILPRRHHPFWREPPTKRVEESMRSGADASRSGLLRGIMTRPDEEAPAQGRFAPEEPTLAETRVCREAS